MSKFWLLAVAPSHRPADYNFVRLGGNFQHMVFGEFDRIIELHSI